ncbi:hypothetical protein CBR_g37132 [Chara braunii]|uniref:DUF659 domain-containing protein n=1 Tax=Chara braunii TaxID=69332 RepID=A0A388LM72_CHABU|nr:hypothetical protein CBR_g37132 [Chara braunii]|eukprot:GBG83418.1 hypothetical protein CBR_g37132 [Chara braunii]
MEKPRKYEKKSGQRGPPIGRDRMDPRMLHGEGNGDEKEGRITAEQHSIGGSSEAEDYEGGERIRRRRMEKPRKYEKKSGQRGPPIGRDRMDPRMLHGEGNGDEKEGRITAEQHSDEKREGVGMTKSSSQAVKKHFREVGISGQADKGNKKCVCNYCDKPVAGTASRAREHFLKGSRCDVGRLRATIPKEEYLRREKGRSAARSELGANMGEPEMEESSEDENAPRTSGGVLDPSGSAAGLHQMNPRTSAAGVVDPSGSVVGLRQTTITDSAAVITAHEQTQRSIDDWMTAECIPFNMMKSEYWDKMVHALMNAPKGFRYAKFQNARAKRVEVTRGRVGKRVEELQQEWPTTGCMLELDGWTDRRQRPHINVMVSFPKGSIFWRSVCMSRHNKGTSAYYTILKRALEEIGAEAVVGVIMDSAAVCAAAGRMIEADYPHIFSVPCTAHSLDLMFESFAKIGWVGAIMKRASELAKSFTNHSRVRDLLIHYSNGGVVSKPGATRWNQSLLDALIKKPKADKGSPQWEEDEPVEDLTRDEMAKDARMRLAEWCAWLHRTEPVSDAGENDDSGSDDDDNPVEAPQMPIPEEVTIQRHRLRSNLLELERQLNESWRKATKASKFLARQHLHELDHATRTMTVEHANKYKAARAIACAPPSIPAKQGRGRARKEVATRGGTGDEEAQDVEVGSLAEGPAPARLTRKRRRPQKQPVQEEEVAPEGTSCDESGGGADENDGGSDESDGSSDGDDGSGDGDDGSGGCDGTDGSGKEDEGDEKDGCSSEEEGDSESEPLSKLRKTSH